MQYGLQALIELALNYGGGPVQIGEIARDQKIPVRYLEQIMLVLKKGGLVTTLRGKMGGCVLAKRPSMVTVLEIIEKLEGEIELANKKLKKSPIIFEAFEAIQKVFLKEFSQLTLEDLTTRSRQRERAYTYDI